MSLVLSNPTLKSGIIELIDREAKCNSVSYPVVEKLSDINGTFDEFMKIAIPAAGKWQFDDSNHEDYPIIMTNLVEGIRDYTFVVDENGNSILDIYRVFIMNEAGVYFEVFPVDEQSDDYTQSFTDGQNISGIPATYDKTANAIRFNVLPSYSKDNGIKMYVNREMLYFVAADLEDTTKKPGVPGLLHNYFVSRPAYLYARRNTLPTRFDLEKQMIKDEAAIRSYFGQREKDVRARLQARFIPFR